MNKKRIAYAIIAFALSGLIVFTSTRTGEDHSDAGGVIIGWVNRVFFGGGLTEYEQSSIVGVGAKFLGHFSLFMLDGLFGYLFVNTLPVSNKKKAILFLGYGLLLSFLGEFIQLFSVGRFATLGDVLIDYTGWTLPFLVHHFMKHPI